MAKELAKESGAPLPAAFPSKGKFTVDFCDCRASSPLINVYTARK
jgi:hypothetical protein